MRGLSLSFAWITVLLGTSSFAYAGDLRAGVARVDLTPPPEFKASLGGYGARMGKPAVGVHDRVFAKASVSFYGETLGQVIVDGAVRGASRL